MIHKAQVVSAEVKAAKAEGRQYVYEESQNDDGIEVSEQPQSDTSGEDDVD